MVPPVALHVTEALVVPETIAVNCSVPAPGMLTEAGLTETLILEPRRLKAGVPECCEPLKYDEDSKIHKNTKE
jgi:hypothetical protein